jgi:hypothetical protein
VRRTIAIHPDDYTSAGQPPEHDASSPRWARSLQAAGFAIRWVDVRRPDILDQIAGCSGFMWRWAHFGGMARIARRLLPVIEGHLGIPVYPSQNTCWHYDDKIAQAYMLTALGVPIPRTWIWYDREEAKKWSSQASYPLVLKLATGAGASNVRLVADQKQAREWIDALFDSPIASLDEAGSRLDAYHRIRRMARILWAGREPPHQHRQGYDSQCGYVLFQEFLPGNAYDTRVTVIGDRAFAFRRFNRAGDFRASGSGQLDVTPASIDEGFLRLAFSTAIRVAAQSLAIDGLYRGIEPVVGEVSYTYVSGAVHLCPGHWGLEGEPASGALHWVDGQMWPEEAQVADFIQRLRRSMGTPPLEHTN